MKISGADTSIYFEKQDSLNAAPEIAAVHPPLTKLIERNRRENMDRGSEFQWAPISGAVPGFGFLSRKGSGTRHATITDTSKNALT